MQLESQGAASGVSGTPLFLPAGTVAAGEFHCTECGYGISVRSLLPECPMCRGGEWEEPTTGPYVRSIL